ncbi:hypothetical protein DT076_01210 [Desertihabitans brevis]|uniref:DUF2567 domain-containing protein n=1 Tax=Desertihabitans brevis TaxID=2268447 RepID=A0A367YZI0_9ACTN|nr:hypothetical protein DT076_01210 [Desertihabitans brevis]
MTPARPEAAGGEEPAAAPARSLLNRVTLFVAACLLVGALSGLVWWAVVDLPGYVIAADGRAATTERGLAQHFGSDAWFVLIGAVAGLLLGLVAWWRLVRIGWPVIPLALVGATVAALLCWMVGHALGPGDFAARLSAAQPGETVPIQLTLGAPVSLVVWPFFATIPILLWSSLAPDAEQPAPLLARRARAERRGRHEAVAGVLPGDLPSGSASAPSPEEQQDGPAPGRARRGADERS